MTTCSKCGNDVTGKKFCSQCGSAVQQAAVTNCPHCSGEVSADAAFCAHCGSSLRSGTSPHQPTVRACSACGTMVPAQNGFCTNCGHNMNTASSPQQQYPTPSYPQDPYNSQQYQQTPYQQSGQYPQPPYQQPSGQSQYPPYQQNNYPQQQYPQPAYQPQPMMGQAPMVLRCPTCMAMAPIGTAFCQSCRTSLAGVPPTYANAPMQGQQGGFLQGNAGKYAMGALGGAAAVIGGEMLLNGLENATFDRRDDWSGERRHHHRDEGVLGELGELADDIGL